MLEPKALPFGAKAAIIIMLRCVHLKCTFRLLLFTFL